MRAAARWGTGLAQEAVATPRTRHVWTSLDMGSDYQLADEKKTNEPCLDSFKKIIYLYLRLAVGKECVASLFILEIRSEIGNVLSKLISIARGQFVEQVEHLLSFCV